MGGTHPQLPKSSDSHRILGGKTRQRWLVPIDPTFLAPTSRNLVSGARTPDFHHNPLQPCLSGLTETQEAEECVAHGSASVRPEAELSKADRVTGCGRRAVLLVQSAWFMSHGKMASLFSKPGMEVWPEPHYGASLMTRSSLFVSLNTVNLRGFEQILLPLGSSNSASVYTMQDAFPTLMINLIHLNSSQKRNHMFPPRMSGSVQITN